MSSSNPGDASREELLAEVRKMLDGLADEELAAFRELDPDDLKALAEDIRSKRATAARLSGPGSIKIRRTETVMYESDKEQPGRPGRILVRGASSDPVEVWQDGAWQPAPGGFALPDGFEGKGHGVWAAFSLRPVSGDYQPINFVRFSLLLQLCGAVHPEMMTAEQFAALPDKTLRSPSRRSLVLAHLLGGGAG